MTEPLSARDVELLLDEAGQAFSSGRYGPARAAGAGAVEAAERLGDPALLVQALVSEANSLSMQGDNAAALTRYTRVLAMAEDPASGGRLDGPDTASAVAKAYMCLVECALFEGGMAVRELLGVLDAGDRFLRSIGRMEWRAGLLLERALINRRLGEPDAAVAAAEEALAIYHPGAHGFTRAGHHVHLGDALCEAGRSVQAEPHYQVVLENPSGASTYDRSGALEGLGRCALERGDVQAARRHVTAAVREAEPLGDEGLRNALSLLVAVCRAEGDLAAAAAAATRWLAAARRVGGHETLYYATRTAVEVALDRGELDVARDLRTELGEHADALDRDTGTTRFADKAAQLRRRLAELHDES